jgi:hypothetical protein
LAEALLSFTTDVLANFPRNYLKFFYLQMPLEDMEIISLVLAGSRIMEGFGKLSSGPVIYFHLMVSFYHWQQSVTQRRNTIAQEPPIPDRFSH